MGFHISKLVLFTVFEERLHHYRNDVHELALVLLVDGLVRYYLLESLE